MDSPDQAGSRDEAAQGDLTREAQSDNNQEGEITTVEPLPPVPYYLAFPGRDFLYTSQDGGLSWQRMHAKAQLNDSLYITAAAINPNNPEHLVIGTSYYGMYESRDGGNTWNDMDPQVQMSLIYQGAGFYDEISALMFSQDGESLFVKRGFGNGILQYSYADASLIEPEERVLNGEMQFGEDEASVFMFNSIITGNEHWPSAYPVPETYLTDNNLPANFERDEAWQQRREAASDKYGIYINSYQVSTRLEEFISYANERGINSVVVDFKDDQGLLHYDSQIETAITADTIRPRFDAAELIGRFHEAGIYVIARVVVFKDRALYAYDNNRYALWDSRLNEPWGVYRQTTPEATEENPNPEPYSEQVEYWVDPYSQFVRDYNIEIARELEGLGVDEIQFDYIRFPSDGKVQDIVTRFLLDENGELSHVDRNSQRVKILATFLSEARDNISIPIGTDVFGFNGWSRMSYLGQDIEVISHYVDVISPMSYPSHYPRSFYRDMTYLDRSQLIYEEGTRRARAITDDRSIIRQYVQAFLIGGELQFEQPTYFDYLDRQLQGVFNSGGSGFTLWNNSGRYYMVDDSSFPATIERFNNRSEIPGN